MINFVVVHNATFCLDVARHSRADASARADGKARSASLKSAGLTAGVALRFLLLYIVGWSMEQIQRGPSDSSSANGDRWLLALDSDTGRVFVRHEPNLPSGGQVADIEIGAFLIADGTGPEKQELLRLIGTLV
jgi:hypothetical protein